MKDKIERAGLIPFYREKTGDTFAMFMMPSEEKYGGMVFQIAKGRIEDGENPFETAIRESEEELGLRRDNIKWVKKCGLFLDTHHIYIAEVNSMDLVDYDEPCFETSRVTWMRPTDFLLTGRKLHKPIVKKCTELFSRQLSRNL